MDTKSSLREATLQRLTLPGERWEEVSGTLGRYRISTYGRLISMYYKSSPESKAMPRIMLPALDTGGYLRTMIRFQDGFKTVKIHRLVASAFVDNMGDRPEVNHKDFDKTNNCTGNLEWVTHKENCEHLVLHGRQTFSNGERNGMSKLTADDVRAIRARYRPYVVMAKDLAREFGVTTACVKDMLRGRTWKHVK